MRSRASSVKDDGLCRARVFTEHEAEDFFPRWHRALNLHVRLRKTGANVPAFLTWNNDEMRNFSGSDIVVSFQYHMSENRVATKPAGIYLTSRRAPWRRFSTVNNHTVCDRAIGKRKFAWVRGINVDPHNFREVADPTVFPNRFSAPFWERSAVAGEQKYCPSEVGHGGKLKELAGSFRFAAERRFRCVVTNCANNTRAFSDVENKSFEDFFVALDILQSIILEARLAIYMSLRQ